MEEIMPQIVNRKLSSFKERNIILKQYLTEEIESNPHNVTFIVGKDGEKNKFILNRFICEVASAELRRILSEPPANENGYEIPDVSSNCFQAVVKWIFREPHWALTSPSEALELAEAAGKLKLHTFLEEICRQLLKYICEQAEVDKDFIRLVCQMMHKYCFPLLETVETERLDKELRLAPNSAQEARATSSSVNAKLRRKNQLVEDMKPKSKSKNKFVQDELQDSRTGLDDNMIIFTAIIALLGVVLFIFSIRTLNAESSLKVDIMIRNTELKTDIMLLRTKLRSEIMVLCTKLKAAEMARDVETSRIHGKFKDAQVSTNAEISRINEKIKVVEVSLEAKLKKQVEDRVRETSRAVFATQNFETVSLVAKSMTAEHQTVAYDELIQVIKSQRSNQWWTVQNACLARRIPQMQKIIPQNLQIIFSAEKKGIEMRKWSRQLEINQKDVITTSTFDQSGTRHWRFQEVDDSSCEYFIIKIDNFAIGVVDSSTSSPSDQNKKLALDPLKKVLYDERYHWQISLQTNQYYTFTNRATGLMLDANEHAKVYPHTKNGNHHQDWKLH